MADPRYFLVRCEATASALRLLAELRDSPKTTGQFVRRRRNGSGTKQTRSLIPRLSGCHRYTFTQHPRTP